MFPAVSEHSVRWSRLPPLSRRRLLGPLSLYKHLLLSAEVTLRRRVSGSSPGVQCPEFSLTVKYIFTFQPSNLINDLYKNRELKSFEESSPFVFLFFHVARDRQD